MENKVLETFEDGRIAWINELMQKCGVISSEQPVQEHTRIVTDAKKQEYPFHKVDRPGTISKKRLGEAGPNDYLKLLVAARFVFLSVVWPGLSPIWIRTIIAVGGETWHGEGAGDFPEGIYEIPDR